ncbi:unnamed protein product [Clonostachys chloroleuca]|uniref:Uncharacterized protein n=1 Tax=Clonostachys chloroleuca TaxID=1926264 RepID=A0AA35Q3B8_9HYPO|nr:unnamed protein product [Clonostachys chloroleuca]
MTIDVILGAQWGDEGVSPRSEPNTARHSDIDDTVYSEGKAGWYPAPGRATSLPSCRKFNEGTNSANSFHDPFAIDYLPVEHLLTLLKGGHNAGQSVCCEQNL